VREKKHIQRKVYRGGGYLEYGGTEGEGKQDPLVRGRVYGKEKRKKMFP